MPIVMADYKNVPPEGEVLAATLAKIKDDMVFNGSETGVMFGFELSDYPGWSATALCSGFPSDKNRFGRIITGLLGELPGPGDNIDNALAACLGNNYKIVVRHNEKEDGRVYLNVEEIQPA
jgi:hypothetical protein